MRSYILGLVGLIGACAPQYTETRVAPGTPLPVNEAAFVQRPELLHTAFQEACDGPTDSYSRLGRDGGRCRMVPPPDVAAALLVRYDGALEIPYIIIERETRKSDAGYVVSISYFATVPLKSGNEQRVYLRSRQLDRTIDQLYRAFGGTPI